MSCKPRKRTLLTCLAMANVTLMVLLVALGIQRYNLTHPQILEHLDHGNGRHSVTILSAAYELDRPYMSMQGPFGNHAAIRLTGEQDKDTTIWLTGVETEIVDAEGHERVSDEFFCHANLTFNPDTTSPEAHNASFSHETHADWRLFTLVPGRMRVRLPEGFGVPLRGDTLVDYFTMALNQNAGPNRRVRMRTIITYSESDRAPMRAVFRRALYVYQQHSERRGDDAPQATASTAHQGELCGEVCATNQIGTTPSWFASDGAPGLLHPGATCCVANASADGVVEQFGSENTIHWMVPPGRHSYRSEVTKQLNLPFDTRVHYVTGHLHPCGRRLWLRDLETGETILEITGEDYEDRLGVARISEIVSSDGIPIDRGRRYELVCEYENTGTADTDAMAILYLYASEAM